MAARIPAPPRAAGRGGSAALFLALPQAAYITGAMLAVDGGLVTA
jgi:NAD(P)-dependent dehydrogenase (short-subunit alcohol dehydrogenase family)